MFTDYSGHAGLPDMGLARFDSPHLHHHHHHVRRSGGALSAGYGICPMRASLP